MSTLRVDTILGESGAERRGLMTYAIICDQKAETVDGGGFTNGAWRTRDLNTEIADPDGIVSIGGNQFTLGAGTYLIEGSAPAYRCNRHVTRLQNITAGTTVQVGSIQYCNQTYNIYNRSVVSARVTLAGNTTFELQHRCQTTQGTNGFGVDTNITGAPSIYTVVKIYKEA